MTPLRSLHAAARQLADWFDERGVRVVDVKRGGKHWHVLAEAADGGRATIRLSCTPRNMDHEFVYARQDACRRLHLPRGDR